jgi:large conductance mechanosensitive channel
MVDDRGATVSETPHQPRERAFLAVPRYALVGFLDFVRERGVVGLAVGFVLATAVQKVVTAFVTDIVNPFIGIAFLGTTQTLAQYTVGGFKVGDFISSLIDFVILILIVYLMFKVLGLDKLDKPKS